MKRAIRQCFERVEGLCVGRFDLGINTRVWLYRIGDTLIDSGMVHAWGDVRRFVGEKPLRQVLLTHHHEDHAGNAGAISGYCGAEVFAHADALDPLAHPAPMRLYQRVLFGRPEPCSATALARDIHLDDGSPLIPIHTPGHAQDLVCYFQPERGWLFTGDLYIGTRPRYLREGECVERMLESLRRVLDYPFFTVFCGHRGVVPRGREAIRDKLIYLEYLCGETRRLRTLGYSVRRISKKLLGGEDLTSLATGYNFTKRHLVRACLETVQPQSGR